VWGEHACKVVVEGHAVRREPWRGARLACDAAPRGAGRDAFHAVVTDSVRDVTHAEIKEMFVTGAEWDTTVLIKHVD
jgi:hypothetical protein